MLDVSASIRAGPLKARRSKNETPTSTDHLKKMVGKKFYDEENDEWVTFNYLDWDGGDDMSKKVAHHKEQLLHTIVEKRKKLARDKIDHAMKDEETLEKYVAGVDCGHQAVVDTCMICLADKFICDMRDVWLIQKKKKQTRKSYLAWMQERQLYFRDNEESLEEAGCDNLLQLLVPIHALTEQQIVRWVNGEDPVPEMMHHGSPIMYEDVAKRGTFTVCLDSGEEQGVAVKIGNHLVMPAHVWEDCTKTGAWLYHEPTHQTIRLDPKDHKHTYEGEQSEPIEIFNLPPMTGVASVPAVVPKVGARGLCQIWKLTGTFSLHGKEIKVTSPRWATSSGPYAKMTKTDKHLSSTLGGWSGSAVIDSQGAAVGLHANGSEVQNGFLAFDQELLDFLGGRRSAPSRS